MNIQWKSSPNFREGRNGRKPVAIVNHITAGLMPGTLSWLQNPQSKASAHYLVSRKGEIFQLVKEEDTAYHAGIVNHPNWTLYDGSNPNRYTIGIEHEGYPDEPLTEQQYQATLWLHQQIIKKWNMPADADHIVGHYRVDSVDRPKCPGPRFPWERLFRDLKGTAIDVSEVPIIMPSGKQLKGFILNLGDGDRTYAGVRDLAEELGFKVRWDEQARTVYVEKK